MWFGGSLFLERMRLLELLTSFFQSIWPENNSQQNLRKQETKAVKFAALTDKKRILRKQETIRVKFASLTGQPRRSVKLGLKTSQDMFDNPLSSLRSQISS